MDNRETLILCVDDDEQILDHLCEVLSSQGYAILLARSGFDALALAFSKKPDLILLDLFLPDISGEEVCRELRRHAPTAKVPVIMLTVKREEADKVRGLEIGADDYVTKPYSAQVLLARIMALLRRRAMSDDAGE